MTWKLIQKIQNLERILITETKGGSQKMYMKRRDGLRYRIRYQFSMILILSMLMVTGCSSNNEDEDILKSISKEKSKETATKLTIFLFGEPKINTDEVYDEIERQSNLNIDLDIRVFNYDSYTEELISHFFSGKELDMFTYIQSIDGLADLYGRDKIYNIANYLPEYAPLLNQRMYEEYPHLKPGVDEILMIPNMYQKQKIPVVIVEKNIAEKYNVTHIDNFQEYTDLLIKINNDYPRMASGKVYERRGGLTLFANALGYTVFDYDSGVVYKTGDPSMTLLPWEQTQAFETMAELIDKWFKHGCRFNDQSGRQTATYLTTYPDLVEGVRTTNIGDGMKDYYVFHLTGGYPVQRFNAFTEMAGGISFAKDSKNVDKGLMFLEWMHENQKNYDLVNFGIKDKHYSLEGEYVNYLDDFYSYEFNPYAGWYVGPFNDWKYHRFNINDALTPDYKEQYMEAFESKVQIAPHEGFMKITTEAIYSAWQQRMAIYYPQVIKAIRNGEFRKSDMESIRDQLKSNGTNAYLKELENQFEEWRLR